MNNDLAQETVAVQAEQNAQAGNPPGVSEATANGESLSLQPLQEGKANNESIGPENLPPELEDTRKNLLRDYHSKMQVLAEKERQFEFQASELRKKGGILDELLSQEWFKKALTAEKQARTGQAEGYRVSDDDYQKALSSKDGFEEVMDRKVQAAIAAMKRELDPKLQSISKTAEDLRAERDYESVADKFEDFRTVHESGELDALLKQGHSFEDAYVLFKGRKGEAPRLRNRPQARPVQPALSPQQRQAASVAKDGLSGPMGDRIIKGKSKDFSRLFDAVWDLHQKGQRAKVEVER